MTKSKICPICKTSFEVPPNHPEQIYCSPRCRGKARQKQTERVCPICGVIFTRNRARNTVYCSCFCEDRSRENTGKKIELVCQYCGKRFITHDKSMQGNGEQQKYCSQTCKGKGIATEHGYNIRVETTFICTHCGKEFTRIAKPKRTYLYCGLRCFFAHMRGPNHRFWQGGTDRYYGPNWDEQRNAALQRDNYRCKHCGSCDNPCVHHLINRKKFNQDWIAMNKLSNLVTLCSPCHSKLHHNPTKTWNEKVALKLYG